MVGIKHESMRKGQTSHKKEHNTRMCFPLKPVFTRDKGGLPNFIDEPTSGLDGTNMRNVSRMIRKLAKMGRTIIVITHDAECALACCERAIRLENGCITDDFQIRGSELLLEKIGYNQSSISGL